MVAGLGGVLLAGCAETKFIVHTAKRVNNIQVAPAPTATYKIGKPYKIKEITYRPRVDYQYQETGIASWYGSDFHGRSTANGEIYDMNALTAAHRTLPLPSFVRVTNLDNGRSINLRVNDRGPFAQNRIIDVSRRVAQLLGFYRKGTAKVRVEILARESRALAARLTGTIQVAAVDTPITIVRLPKPAVSSEILPPPPGASIASASVSPPPSPVPPGATGDGAESVTDAAEPKLGVVSVQEVAPTLLFIQAGAFSFFENANRARAKLSMLGPVGIFSVLVDGKDLFRVRVGPLNSIANADQMLEWVIRRGYSDSRIIVE